jgi:type II secretory pathway pseudopilin PulG
VKLNPMGCSASFGFTLIEVLAAFAILVTALILGSVAFSRHLNVTRLLDHTLAASALADRQAIEALERYAQQVPVEARGEEGIFRWEVSAPEPMEADQTLQTITARVSWEFWGHERSASISTGLLPERDLE